jgi:hypothetical protein
MNRKTFLRRTLPALVAAGAFALAFSAQAQNNMPKIAVTDLAYTLAVSQYFEAGTFQQSSRMSASGSAMASAQHGMAGGSQMHSGQHQMSGSSQSSGTYMAGRYSYIEHRQLGAFTNDIKGALLRGTAFRLVQGKAFDAGEPQASKAEQALNQIQTGKMAKPVRQPDVKDIIARIRKGEFPGADYVLFGTLSSIEFRDTVSPLQGTTSASHQFSLDLLADFSLINTKTYEIKSAFSAQGAGNDTKLLSNRGDVVPPNRAKVMRETSQSLAMSVYEQLVDQLGYSDPNMARGVRQPMPGMPGQPQVIQPAQPETVIILK